MTNEHPFGKKIGVIKRNNRFFLAAMLFLTIAFAGIFYGLYTGRFFGRQGFENFFDGLFIFLVMGSATILSLAAKNTVEFFEYGLVATINRKEKPLAYDDIARFTWLQNRLLLFFKYDICLIMGHENNVTPLMSINGLYLEHMAEPLRALEKRLNGEKASKENSEEQETKDTDE